MGDEKRGRKEHRGTSAGGGAGEEEEKDRQVTGRMGDGGRTECGG